MTIAPIATTPFAETRAVDSISECYFYHSMDIPGHGAVSGEWDLRPGIRQYLGQYDFIGKRVLDVGAASGFLSFHMEKLGGDVVSYDLSEDWPWDIIPFSVADNLKTDNERRRHMRLINNGYWLAHGAFKSRARVAYGTVYDIPVSIGPVDIAVFGSILLHLRDPFLALQNGARLAREAVIVTDVAPYGRLGRFLTAPRFQGNHQRPENWGTWWNLPPRLVREYLSILGFAHSTITWHRQLFSGRPRWLYTVVARRISANP
jgi:SAM-dependent methyltransferase